MKLFAAFFLGTIALFGASAQGQQFQVLYKFSPPPGEPRAGLIQGSDGNFYGMTYYGGPTNKGTVFKMDSLGTVTTLHSFVGNSFAGSDGANPVAGLIQGSDGNFYGTTLYGGVIQMGTAFKMDSSGAVTTLHSFAGIDGAYPYAGLIQGSDRNFYGTTFRGGPTNNGTVFKMDSLGAVTTLHSFARSDGANPTAGLIQGSDGNFYGTTFRGGLTDNGTVFKMDSLGAVTTLYSFAGTDGANPYAGLIQGRDGNFYGTTLYGGATGNGTVFKMNSLGVVTTLHSFAGTDGAYPYAGLIQGSDGNFYGTTLNGGATDKGTVFKMGSSGVVTTLHSFAGLPLAGLLVDGYPSADGRYPIAGLIQGLDGNFYGTTAGGGTADNGTVFKMDSLGAVTTLHSFAGTDGAQPTAGLIQGLDGNFYGTTSQGGATDNGTVFKMNSSGAVTTLHSFAAIDGAHPAGLIQGSDGNFYGTTLYGGAIGNGWDGAGYGTVFKMNSSGVVTTLHFFAGSDGAYPQAGLIQASDGSFYGTTAGGVTADNGTVFKMNSLGVLTTLHSFAGSDGAYPRAGLIQASDGSFYGTTSQGGATNNGTVFKMDSLSTVTTLHSFAGSDGANPKAGLIQGLDGNFYGTTYGGGGGAGTVFRIIIAPSPTITNGPPPNGTVGVAYNFAYTSTGSPTFRVTAGSLPPGLSLSAAGVISGSPTTAGTFPGTVTASNGTAPNAAQNFSIIITSTAPTLSISAITPSAVCQGGPAFTLTVDGSGFVSGSVVQLDNSPRSTTFVSSTRLTATMTASDIAAAGSRIIKVVNPDSASSTTTLTVTADTIAPTVTAPAAITIMQTMCPTAGTGGATGSTSPALASYVTSGSATDNCTQNPSRLAPQAGGSDVTNSTVFPAGTTTVTFRFRDNAGNAGTATSTVTVRLFADLNADNAVDAQDLVIMANYLVGNMSPGRPPFVAPISAGDLNGDGRVDAVDFVIQANYLVGNITCLPSK